MIRKDIKTNSMKKIVIFASIIVALVCIAGVSLYFLNKSHQSTDNGDNANTLTEEQKEAAGYIDDQPATNDQTSTGTDIKQDSIDEEDEEVSAVTGEFTMLEQSGSTVRIRTILSGVSSGGSCVLTMSGPSGGTYSATSQVQALASSSTCQGFDVPVSNLKTGKWTVSVKVTMAGDTAVLEGEVDIK